MELEAGKKYRTEYGIGRAVDADKYHMALYFDTPAEDDGRPMYYIKGNNGKSNISFITTLYDAIEEV